MEGETTLPVAENPKKIADDFLSYLASETDDECEDLYAFALDALTFANKVQIWHWTCGSGFHHTHFEAIYDAIRDFADKLAETAMSMSHEFKLQSKSYSITNEKYELAAALLKLQEFRNKLEQYKKQYSSKISLDNLFADIIETLDRELGLIKNFS